MLSRRSLSHSDENSMMSHDSFVSPTYLLEHLATFAVSSQNDLMYPADGMRRLLSMEKTSGIWTQKMSMKIDKKLIVIMDHESQEIVEKFPLRLVRDPTAFTSSDPKEVYNNILIYIVGHPSSGSNPAEMHIFQCVNVRAREIVELLKGRGRRSNKNNETSRGEVLAPPYEDLDSEVIPRMANTQLVETEEASSTSSDSYDHDVTILNRCFDDIERFIVRLQHSASAFRELEKRRRSRKSIRRDIGDGMLSVRAKPPPENDFVEIFQKFKLCFNLLAKLKAHIHDPNAPELVHFLFTPLALIVDAAHDSHYGPNLPTKILSPLLTSDAVELLTNCLTSKETELWNSLGEVWFVPDVEWEGYIPDYKPLFKDNHSLATLPESFNRDDDDVNDDEIGIDEVDIPARKIFPSDSEMDASLVQQTDHRRRNSHIIPQRVLHEEYQENPISQSEEEDLSIFNDRASSFQTQGYPMAEVVYPRTASNDKELTVVRGELVEVLDDSRNWWRVKNSRGHIGHVPRTIVNLCEDTFEQPSLRSTLVKQHRNSQWNQSLARKEHRRYFS